ncbi:MAG: hypothetical protein WD342_13665, partial [Verrucomicrobiales bacterium]
EGEKGKGKGKGQGTEPGKDGQAGGGELAENQNGGSRPGWRQQDGGLNLGGPDSGGPDSGGDDRGERQPSGGQPLFFNRQSEQRVSGPITGEDYADWSDSLGNIEEMLPQDDLRNSVARVLDDARAMRIDFRRDNAPPAADVIDQRITAPLIELRERIGEELAKLNKDNPLAPIDRDPVPSEFRDLVRRYYEELGAGD